MYLKKMISFKEICIIFLFFTVFSGNIDGRMVPTFIYSEDTEHLHYNYQLSFGYTRYTDGYTTIHFCQFFVAGQVDVYTESLKL